MALYFTKEQIESALEQALAKFNSEISGENDVENLIRLTLNSLDESKALVMNFNFDWMKFGVGNWNYNMPNIISIR